MRDSSPLRDLAEHLKKQAPPKRQADSLEAMPAYVSAILEAFDNALVMIGRSGTEVFHDMMHQIYGLERVDIARKPGQYMSALKVMLDSAADVIESYVLREIKKSRDLSARSIEDAVNKLRDADEATGQEKTQA